MTVAIGAERRPVVGGAVLLTLGICLLFGIGNVVYSATAWEIPDIGAYWNAALRLREGGPLYPPVTDVNASDVYRYAPWFAAAWIPLTYLPRPVVDAAWSVVLLAASAAVVLAALRARSRAALAFTVLIGSFLVLIASRGNVQPLMVAALAFGVERRSGPLWIALCASLKATPILFVIVYVARGEWGRAAATIVLTVVLVAPMLLFAVVAASSVLVAGYVAWRHRPWAWLAASVAVILCLPRAFTYELTFLFVGLVPAIEAWRRRPVTEATA